MEKRRRQIYIFTLSFILIASAALLIYNNSHRRENRRDTNIQSNTASQNSARFKTIGLIAGDMQDKSTANIFSILKNYSKENENIRMLLFDSEEKPEKQMLQLEDLIAMKVDGIIISPVKNSFTESTLNKLSASDIPAVLISSSNISDTFISRIGTASMQVGREQAEYLAHRLDGKGNILVLTGSSTNYSVDEKLTGFMETIDKYPHMKIEEIISITGNNKISIDKLQEALLKHKKIDAIILQKIDLSLQIQPLLDKLDINPYIVGVDTAPEVLESLKEERLDASIYTSSNDIAQGAYDIMMKAIKKEAVPEVKIIPHTLITSENIDDYIENNLNYKIK